MGKILDFSEHPVCEDSISRISNEIVAQITEPKLVIIGPAWFNTISIIQGQNPYLNKVYKTDNLMFLGIRVVLACDPNVFEVVFD